MTSPYLDLDNLLKQCRQHLNKGDLESASAALEHARSLAHQLGDARLIEPWIEDAWWASDVAELLPFLDRAEQALIRRVEP